MIREPGKPPTGAGRSATTFSNALYKRSVTYKWGVTRRRSWLVTGRRRHTVREVTVRRLYPGPRRLDIQINGHVLAGTEVTLTKAIE